MKRLFLPTLVVLASGAWALLAQDDAAIQKALSAAPARLAKDATVIKWKADFTYDTLKKGTNDLVCYDRTESEVRSDGCRQTGRAGCR
jgi:hypothetical protein